MYVKLKLQIRQKNKTMELNKKSLFLTQATKIEEFINYLSANLAANEIANETNALPITRHKSKKSTTIL